MHALFFRYNSDSTLFAWLISKQSQAPVSFGFEVLRSLRVGTYPVYVRKYYLCSQIGLKETDIHRVCPYIDCQCWLR